MANHKELVRSSPELNHGLEGSTLELLQRVVKTFPDYSPGIYDLIKYLESNPQNFTYLTLHTPVDYYRYYQSLVVSASQGGDWWQHPKPENLVFLLVTAPHKGRQLATLASPEYHDHEYDPFTSESGFFTHKQGLRLELMHGLGYTDTARTVAKANNIQLVGSRSPYYPQIGHNLIMPTGEEVRCEHALEYFLTITNPTYEYRRNGFYGPSTMRSASWGQKGCLLIALPGISCDYRRQKRNFEKEITPLTETEIAQALGKLYEDRRDINLYLSNPGYYLRGTQPLYEAIEANRKKLAQLDYFISLLEKAQKDPRFTVTSADLGIHIYD